MHKKAKIYIVKLFVQRVIGLLLYLLGAWWTLNLRALIYFILYFVMVIISCVIMYRLNPETLAERNKWNTDSPKWDKLLLGAYWLLAFFVIYLIAGFEASKASPVGIVFSTGVILQLSASALSLWAVMTNTFLESTARIQTDRAQVVCKTGPYKFIRHPTYASVLLWCVSIYMVFGTLFVGLISAVIAVIIIIRTCLEDKMLKEHLGGYKEYMKEVKYRIMPFVW